MTTNNMTTSNQSLIEHIPRFLEFCQKEKHFSLKSIKSYNQSLNRFVIWLRQSNLTHLLPKGLSLKHIQEYKNYLSKQISPENNRFITKKTQNYYLIAIRALLFYFIEKDISSLLPQKIKLLKEEKYQSIENKSLNLEYFKKLLEMPDASTLIIPSENKVIELNR